MNDFDFENFLKYEITDKTVYEKIIEFIKSYNIRNGEYEGNEYIIKKMDRENFIIYVEHSDKNFNRDIHSARSIYKNELLERINNYYVKGLI